MKSAIAVVAIPFAFFHSALGMARISNDTTCTQTSLETKHPYPLPSNTNSSAYHTISSSTLCVETSTHVSPLPVTVYPVPGSTSTSLPKTTQHPYFPSEFISIRSSTKELWTKKPANCTSTSTYTPAVPTTTITPISEEPEDAPHSYNTSSTDWNTPIPSTTKPPVILTTDLPYTSSHSWNRSMTHGSLTTLSTITLTKLPTVSSKCSDLPSPYLPSEKLYPTWSGRHRKLEG